MKRDLLGGEEVNVYSHKEGVVRAVVCAGLYPNIAKLKSAATKGSPPSFLDEEGSIDLHPSSVAFQAERFRTSWVVYHEKVKTTKVYLRDSCSISPFAVILFGGKLSVDHQGGTIAIDSWIKFAMSPKDAVRLKRLRHELDSILLDVVKTPNVLPPSAQTSVDATAVILDKEWERICKQKGVA
uniref:DEAD-box helicase OB fold domain-containing protein n=1 Tax=Palpitomonas bilix TaxID=652834 RepID=A0A7S3DCS6_9EUKA